MHVHPKLMTAINTEKPYYKTPQQLFHFSYHHTFWMSKNSFHHYPSLDLFLLQNPLQMPNIKQSNCGKS